MADPILEEEDDLISQDDIDKLLDISPGDDDAGELSQNDIDNLLNGTGPDQDDPDTGEEDAGELSQDDIDRMMAGNALDDDAPPEDDGGELSQDDIDRMTSGEDDQDEDLELISQTDIDQFMNDSLDTGSGDDDDDDELISLKDIQNVMDGETQVNDASGSPLESGPVPAREPDPGALGADSNQDDVAAQEKEDATVDDAPAAEAPGPEEDPFDEPIDEDQAADVADCMITQEAMDAMIEAGLPDRIDLTSATDDFSPDDVAREDEQDNVSPDDVAREDEPEDFSPDDENEVTQDDIDALLQQSDEKDGFLDEDEDILISQDDINTLLMAAGQEDEDLLGDISGENDASELDNQLDDLESDSDQVVLESIEGDEISDKDESASAGASKKAGKIKTFLKSKVMLAAASILLFIGISVPLSYFLFFSSEPVPLPERQTASLTEIDLTRDGQTDFSADIPDIPPSRKSGTILLTDFIILASDQSQTMTYVSADVSIDYSDQRAYDEISSHLAFYRDLIYGAIQTRLVSEKNNEMTEADLLWGVEASLKKVLPPQYIDKIYFKSFKAT